MEFLSDLILSERFNLYRNVAAVLGTLWLSKCLLSELQTLGSGFWAYFLAPWGICRTNVKNYGQWAVITGASEGIGKGYALELARQGLNVVIISRSLEKLTAVETEIKSKYKRDVIVLPIDFSEGKPPKGTNGIYSQIAERLASLDVGVLVNNVGLSHDHPELTLDIPEDNLRNVIELNCQAMVHMTHIVMKKMVQEKRRGLIINVSSASSLHPLPLLGVYAATKIFVNYFSESLRVEYGSKGITIQTVMPAFVATSMSKIRKASFFVPDPVSFTRAAVATVGIQNETMGCFAHALQYYVQQKLPQFLVASLAWKVLWGARVRALKKKPSKKAE
eukprot:Em0014g4a